MKEIGYAILRSLCWLSPAAALWAYQAGWGFVLSLLIGNLFGAIGMGLVLFIDRAAEEGE